MGDKLHQGENVMDDDIDECVCGHMRDEHKLVGFTRACLVEGCDCFDFEREADDSEVI